MSERNSVAGSQVASAAPPAAAPPAPAAEMSRQGSQSSAMMRKPSTASLAAAQSGLAPPAAETGSQAGSAPGMSSKQASGQLPQIAVQESSMRSVPRRESAVEMPLGRQSSQASVGGAGATMREPAPAPSERSRRGSVVSAGRATLRSSKEAMEAVVAAVTEEIAEGGEPSAVSRQPSAAAISRQPSYAAPEQFATEPAFAPETSTSFQQLPAQYDHNDPVALNTHIEDLERQLREKDNELRNEKMESEKLNKQVESQQRLLNSNSQDSKVRMLNEEIQKRAQTIKKLEEENKRLSKKAESSARGLDRTQSRQSVQTVTGVEEHELAARDVKIRELEDELGQCRSDLQRKRAEVEDGRRALGAAKEKAAAAGVELGDVGRMNSRVQSMAPSSSDVENIRLRQMVAEREAERQQLQCRLDRAQEAILSSAGTGFENEVKLQQARTALQCILKAHRGKSPDGRDARTQSASGGIPRDISQSPAFANPVSAGSAAYRSRTDVSGAGVYAFPYPAGKAPILPPPPPGPGMGGAYRSYSPMRDRLSGSRRVQ